MTSKTFHDDDRKLEVQENGGKVNLYIEGKINELGVEIAPSDAPALALAILEVAGIDSALLAEAKDYLKSYIEVETNRTAEAEAQAKLEAEAVKLANAGRSASVVYEREPVLSFHDLDTEFWLAVARRAREMRAEK